MPGRYRAQRQGLEHRGRVLISRPSDFQVPHRVPLLLLFRRRYLLSLLPLVLLLPPFAQAVLDARGSCREEGLCGR